jgi:pSer/pThr/pTyr-binding forkhead associated (FHA) protein
MGSEGSAPRDDILGASSFAEAAEFTEYDSEPAFGAPTRAPPALPPPAAALGPFSVTLFTATGDQMAQLAIPAQRSVTIALRFEDSGPADDLHPPHHVTFTRRGNRLFVSDASVESGIFLKLHRHESWLLEPADKFRIGEQTLLFVQAPSPPSDPSEAEDPSEPFIGLLELLPALGNGGRTLVVPEGGFVCGRERGDLTFPDDCFVSTRHCAIHRADDGLVYLTDLGSTNGTFVYLDQEYPVESGDILRTGPIFFRVDFGSPVQ